MPNDLMSSEFAAFDYGTLLAAPPEACACGSGLAAARCCALDRSLPPAVEPLAEVLASLQASRRGGIDEAAALCLRLLDEQPTLLPALHLLFMIRRDQDATDAALALGRRLCRLAPRDQGMAAELAVLLVRRELWAEAERQARHSLRLSPLAVDAHRLLARVFVERKNFAAAAFQLRTALGLAGERRPVLLHDLAQALLQQGALEEARGVVGEALEADPRDLPALMLLAQIEEYSRDPGAAEAALARAGAVCGDQAPIRESRARLAADAGRPEDALALLAPAEGEAGQSVQSLLLQGRLLDRLERCEEAFAAFDAAQRVGYDAAEAGRQRAWIEGNAAHSRKFFVSGLMGSLPRAGVVPGEQPVFITGFARSGTTLVEQSLSMHPQIAARGELHALRHVVQQTQRILHSALPYPNALTELWMGDRRFGLDALRDTYLAEARAPAESARPGATLFTDKMVFNEMHLALISLIFPQAPIIHMIRHPLDVVLSVFSHQLSGGIRSRNTLEEIAHHYTTTMDLVDHYVAEGCAGRYLPVRYEDVVADQRVQLERMLGHIGVAFDEACERFDTNPRYARTLSFGQVRRSLNSDGVFRYRRYRRQLSPIYPILEPLIGRLGYVIE